MCSEDKQRAERAEALADQLAEALNGLSNGAADMVQAWSVALDALVAWEEARRG